MANADQLDVFSPQGTPTIEIHSVLDGTLATEIEQSGAARATAGRGTLRNDRPLPFWKRIFTDLAVAGLIYPIYCYWIMAGLLLTILPYAKFGDDKDSYPVAVVNSDIFPTLSQPFLDSLPGAIVQLPYSELNEALDAVKCGKAQGLLRIGQNFSTALLGPMFSGNGTMNCSIEVRKLDIDIHFIDPLTRLTLQRPIFRSLIVSMIQKITVRSLSPASPSNSVGIFR